MAGLRIPPASARTLGWLAAVFVWAALVTACLWDYYPPINAHQRYTLVLAKLTPGTSEPLIVTGQTGSGDFLFVRYIDEHHAAIGYDRWGSGGPVSRPIEIQPGTPHALEVTLPSLAYVRGNPFLPASHLQVRLDGDTLLDAVVEPHTRKPMRIWFGTNPIGGSSCDAELHGRLTATNGRPILGGVRSVFTRSERFSGWLRYAVWQALAVFLLGVAAGWTVARCARRPALPVTRAGWLAPARSHQAFLWTAGICALAFTWIVTCGSWQLLYEDVFGTFYDFQAQSFLGGRLDVPEEALSGEAFIAHGKVYGYFGVTPAILRLPFAVFGIGFGKLTRVALLCAYLGTLLGAYALLRQAFSLAKPGARPGPLLTTLFVLSVGLGSTIFYLGSRAYVYHEAIAWGVMFAVWACWFALKQWQHPPGRAWIPSLLCGVLSVHARPPTGLYALTVLGVVAAALLLRHRNEGRAVVRYVLVGAAAVAGVASFNAVSFLKFGTFEGCPLRMNVQYTPARLARIDGKQFHTVNIPFAFTTYFLQPGIESTPEFPWFHFRKAKAASWVLTLKERARMDMTDPTASVPVAMTGLVFLALIGGIAAFAVDIERGAIAIVGVAAVPLIVAMCAAIATSHRYTGDFVPFLITAAALGATVVTRLSTRFTRVFLACFAIAALWSACVTPALTLRYQGEMGWGQPDGVQLKYQQLRDRIDRFISSSVR